MNLSLRKLFLSKHVLKVNALILGYWLWSIISTQQVTTVAYTVPLSFYGDQEVAVEAPEYVTLTLRGYKKDLLLIMADELAVYCNTDMLARGKFPLVLTQKSLFLPDSIKMIHYSPSPLVITVTNNTQSVLENELHA
jgi:hypothetical protein